MKLFVTGFLFIAALFACSLPDPGCDDHSCDGCRYVLKEHAEKMIYHLQVRCPYDTACNATLLIFQPVLEYENECKIDNFEYMLISGSFRKKMQFGTNVDLPISSDDHLRFSLLDSAKVEKKYDIDLSGIIHPYTFDNDSIRITLPSHLIEFCIECPYCPNNANDIVCVKEDEYENSTIVVGLDPSLGKYFDLNSWLVSQGPNEKDSIEVNAQVYFRE